jgi:hypothetical protein
MRRILYSAVDEVSEALSMHVAPLAIWIVVVPTGVTVLLGLHNPPRSWTSCHTPVLKSTEPKPPYVCLGCLITRVATI